LVEGILECDAIVYGTKVQNAVREMVSKVYILIDEKKKEEEEETKGERVKIPREERASSFHSPHHRSF
jgi:hypothetical protein